MKDRTKFGSTGKRSRQPKSESQRVLEEKIKSSEFRENMKPYNK